MSELTFASSATIERELLAIWRDAFRNENIAVEDDFFDLGGHSMLAALISARVGEDLKLALPIDEIYRTPTVRELALYIEQQAAAERTSAVGSTALVPFKIDGAELPVLFLPAMLGTVVMYRSLGHYLTADRPLYGIQAKGLLSAAAPNTSLPDMAQYSIHEMQKVQPAGPYHLVGYSLGGVIAFEMAQQLRAAGADVALLVLIDSFLMYNPAAPRWRRAAQLRYGRQIDQSWRRLQHYARLLRQPHRALERTFARLFWRNDRQRQPTGAVISNSPTDQAKPAPAIVALNKQALARYRPQRYPGRIVYLHSNKSGARRGLTNQVNAWSYLAGAGMSTYSLPASHTRLLDEPGVAYTAKALDQCLRGLAP